MWVVHQRLAELWFIAKRRNRDNPMLGLTDREVREFIESLEANMQRAWRLAHLYNLSFMASMIDNTTMQHEVCSEIDKIQGN